jgi:hypothetical protein
MFSQLKGRCFKNAEKNCKKYVGLIAGYVEVVKKDLY